jgi:hypothetical protein
MAAQTNDAADADGSVPDPMLVETVAEALPDATNDEAAAIAVVLGAHLTDHQQAAASEAGAAHEGPSWAGREWSFAGRVQQTRHRSMVRMRDGTPSDAWSAAGRVDRL